MLGTMQMIRTSRRSGRIHPGGGYMIASAMPFVAGAIRDRFDNLAQARMLMAAGVVALIVIVIATL